MMEKTDRVVTFLATVELYHWDEQRVERIQNDTNAGRNYGYDSGERGFACFDSERRVRFF